MKCVLSDLAIAGPAGVMLPCKCHIGINYVKESIMYWEGGRWGNVILLRNAGSISVTMTDIVVITIICMHNMGYDDKKNVYSVLSDIS